MTATTLDQINHLQKVVELTRTKEANSEAFFMINGISWAQFEALLTHSSEQRNILFKYLEGNLEIMAPSRNHERIKKLLGMLLECYFIEMEINFFSLGSTTFKNKALARGIEPDDCYCFGHEKEIPDLAIEVVITSGGINSLEIYQGLGVPEVWFWEKDTLQVYVLINGQYQMVSQSQLLPNLDLALIQNYLIDTASHLQIIQQFKKMITQ